MSSYGEKLSYRIAQILIRLYNQERLDEKELAKEFDVSIKTIKRDIKQRLAAVPISRDRGGILYLDGMFLDANLKQSFKKFATVFGFNYLPTELSDEIVSMILNSYKKPIKIQSLKQVDILQSDIFEKLTKAILSHQVIQAVYNKTKRRLNPYKLVNHFGVWYLLADEDDKIKTFTVYKLKALSFQKEYFTPNPDFVNLIEEKQSCFFANSSYEVILEIDSVVKEYFLKRNTLTNQKIIDEKNDKIILSTMVDYDDEILHLIWQYIPYIKILSPKELVLKNKQILSKYLKSL